MVKNLLLQFYFVIFFTHVFAEKIEDLHPLFSSTHWGAYVVEKDSKTVIFSHHANRFFIPASLTKLFTAAKALQILGPEHRFSTVVKSSIEPQEGKIQGNLYLVGGADPFLTS